MLFSTIPQEKFGQKNSHPQKKTNLVSTNPQIFDVLETNFSENQIIKKMTKKHLILIKTAKNNLRKTPTEKEKIRETI